MRKLTGILLMLMLAAVLCAAAAETAGTCGAGITWTLDSEGLLRVEGSGEMADGAFWKDAAKAEAIRRVEIGEGVTRIGEGAFAGCTELSEVILPERYLISPELLVVILGLMERHPSITSMHSVPEYSCFSPSSQPGARVSAFQNSSLS